MSRKYRQRGYQDSDREERERRKPPPKKKPLTPEEKAQRRGLRHATKREANEVVRCPDCGNNVQAIGAIMPETTCPRCSTALHCCRACLHFDPRARWECRADITERVPDKMKANDCETFDPRLVLDATGKRLEAKSSNDPRSRFEDLFKR
jgi:hypothetical protein